MVKYLLSKTYLGKTVIDPASEIIGASENGHLEVVKYLLDKVASTETRDINVWPATLFQD